MTYIPKDKLMVILKKNVFSVAAVSVLLGMALAACGTRPQTHTENATAPHRSTVIRIGGKTTFTPAPTALNFRDLRPFPGDLTRRW